MTYNSPHSHIALVTGAFDIMHIGHIRMLQYAASLSDKGLIVMIDTDERIRNQKGPSRPFNCFSDREEFLHAIEGIDYVQPISEDEDIILTCRQFRPIRVVGGDWKGKEIVGAEFCSEIRYFDRIPGYSTTRILDDRR